MTEMTSMVLRNPASVPVCSPCPVGGAIVLEWCTLELRLSSTSMLNFITSVHSVLWAVMWKFTKHTPALRCVAAKNRM